MSVYRPVGYGPPPSKAIMAELRRVSGGRPGRWLVKAGPEQCPFLFEDDGRTKMYAQEWCAIALDGLPCAIGTPPESEPTERERLLREAVEARRSGGWLRELVHARAYLDHIIAEEDADAAR